MGLWLSSDHQLGCEDLSCPYGVGATAVTGLRQGAETIQVKPGSSVLTPLVWVGSPAVIRLSWIMWALGPSDKGLGSEALTPSVGAGCL